MLGMLITNKKPIIFLVDSIAEKHFSNLRRAIKWQRRKDIKIYASRG